MARIIQATTTDLEALDTNIFSNITEDGTTPVSASFESSSTKAAGIVKLVNMFIKLMYTLKGTNYLDKEEGTYFTNLFTLNVQDSDVAQAKVQDAIDEAADQLFTIQAKQGAPNTERLKQAFISHFEVNDDREVIIGITLEVLAGGSVTVQLPSITVDEL